MKKRGKDMSKLDDVIDMLCDGRQLPTKYDDHPLFGENKGSRECHIEPDWLLKYRIDKDELILVAMRTGSHSDFRLR